MTGLSDGDRGSPNVNTAPRYGQLDCVFGCSGKGAKGVCCGRCDGREGVDVSLEY